MQTTLSSRISLRVLSLATLSLGLFSVSAGAQAPTDSKLLLLPATSSLSSPFSFGDDLSSSSGSSSSGTSLPDSPEPQQATNPSTGQPLAGPGHAVPRQARPTDPIVSPGQIAPSQTVRDKVVVSIKNSISPFSIAGDTISAGYSHLTNSSPNYGTDGNAFAQRFGAAVARGSSQSIFSSGVLAPVLHEDPRYYQLGRGHSIVNRGVYAATRVLITRTDSGRKTPNFALLGGYLGAAALTQTYYPPVNTSATEIAKTYGGSLGGAAIGFAVNEFLSDSLQILHLKKIQ